MTRKQIHRFSAETSRRFRALRQDTQERLGRAELRNDEFLAMLLDVYALHLEREGRLPDSQSADEPRLVTDGGQDIEHYGAPTGPSHHEPDAGDPSNWCYECGDTAIGHCGCCGMPLCGRHLETQAGFCSDRVTIDTQVGAVPACIRPGLDDADYDIAVDAPAFNYELPDDERLSPDELWGAVEDALPDQLIGRAEVAVGDAVDAVASDDATVETIEALREIEQLLRGYLDARTLSSSSAHGTGITTHGETVQLGYRVQTELKEEFASLANEHYDENLGAVLTRALNSYRQGGRRQRVFDLIHHLVTDGSTGDTTADTDESSSEIREVHDTTDGADESRARSSDARDTTDSPDESTRITTDRDEQPVVDAMVVADIANELDEAFERDEVHRHIALKAGGDADTIQAYTEAVTDYKNVLAHPVREDLYIPEAARDGLTVYEDLDRDQRVDALRTMLCAEALRVRANHHSITYTDVQSLFETEYVGAPSHDYAYMLMEGVPRKRGLSTRRRAIPTNSESW